MYFPYLRGKQFELIALRELCKIIGQNEFISPIIEPVKESTVTLEKTIDCLIESNFNFNFVINPQVGDFKKKIQPLLKIIDSKLTDYTNYQPSIIVDNKTNLKNINEIIDSNNLENISIICLNIPNDSDAFFDLLENQSIKYVVVNEEINSKRFLREIRKKALNKISLSDPFISEKRNVDYIKEDHQFFSDEHLFFDEEGFIGYSDYTVIGKDYNESGFLPYAVAIHLTYLNQDKEFWIKHFVSDSNEDTTDVAGKFGEALYKLIIFIDENSIKTSACDEFRKFASSQSYPGLGSIKKLSVMNHIELVHNYFKGI